MTTRQLLGRGLAALALAAAGSCIVLSPAAAAPPTPSPGSMFPNCGSTINISNASIDYSDQTITFKIIGTDLSKWLGANGHGVMAYEINEATDSYSGSVAASGGSGARTQSLIAEYPTIGTKPTALVAIEGENGVVLCEGNYAIN